MQNKQSQPGYEIDSFFQSTCNRIKKQTSEQGENGLLDVMYEQRVYEIRRVFNQKDFNM